MAETVTISKQKYEELKQKARAFEKITDSEGISKRDLLKIKKAKKTKLLTEKEFFDSN